MCATVFLDYQIVEQSKASRGKYSTLIRTDRCI